MPSPRTSTPSTATGTDALLYLLFGAVGAAIVFGSLAWLSGDAANFLVGPGRWVSFNPTGALTHPAQLWPGLSPTMLLVAARIAPGVLTCALAAAGVAGWLRLRGSRTGGLARKAELAPLLDKEITAKARSLRPSLNGRECKRGRAC